MSPSSTGNTLDMSVYVGINGAGFDPNPISTVSSTLGQPIPIDANGDLQLDLLGMTSDSVSLRLWQNVFNASQSGSPIFDVVNAPFDGPPCTIANPHSNAVVDLNGDCLADVFLFCEDGKGNKYFQIWINDKSDGFKLAQQETLPSGIQSFSFADMDRDGTVDMVFTTCSDVSMDTGVGTDCAINIAYNQQLPLCTSSATSGFKGGKRVCRPPELLCTADPDFRFDLTPRSNNTALTTIPISSLIPPTSTSSSAASLLVFDTTTSPPLPLPIKLGDINMDGFPDILFIAASAPHGGFLGIGDHVDTRAVLAESIGCAGGVSGMSAVSGVGAILGASGMLGGESGMGKRKVAAVECTEGGGRRGFEVVKKGAALLSQIKDARGAAFIDIDEDGTLDIMVQRTGSQGRGKVAFVQNNFFFDAFFLKAIVLNGACDSGWCEGRNGSARYHPFGVSYTGASYKYTVLDTSGRRSAAQVSQLPQTGYHSLLPPYSFFGLGRTNNYIENLFVGSMIKHPNPDQPSEPSEAQSQSHFVSMEGVIPNSRVVIYPPPPSSDGAEWRKELYLRPGEWIPWVTLTLVIATVLLAIVVFVFHLN
ncbi:hypothetical protein BD410DRAFT_737497, partial [Rickenella mellea]